MDDVVGSKAKAEEADVSEVTTDEKVETDFVEAEIEKPVVIDLSPSVVNKATFVELLRAG